MTGQHHIHCFTALAHKPMTAGQHHIHCFTALHCNIWLTNQCQVNIIVTASLHWLTNQPTTGQHHIHCFTALAHKPMTGQHHSHCFTALAHKPMPGQHHSHCFTARASIGGVRGDACFPPPQVNISLLHCTGVDRWGTGRRVPPPRFSVGGQHRNCLWGHTMKSNSDVTPINNTDL